MVQPQPQARGMLFRDTEEICSTPYVAPKILAFAGAVGPGTRVLDLGCGSGYWASRFAGLGCTAVGIDPSESGIGLARAAHPNIRFEQMEASETLLADLNEEPFDIVVSTEVVEHTYDPMLWARGACDALRPGGRFLLSTPYHGWLKNVAVAVTGKYDFHHDTLRVGGHIKFFSNARLTALLREAGFSQLHFAGAGRVPFLWKSIVVRADA